ncbi:MAG: hypothetical protein KJ634_14345 [Gammaproteobacteria bacterium]|nr:hypothetical protein [Gammaproteobacteria bacterium]MBU1416793.1 hypothetical protein [Gammaproteobacteria bacterium]
MAKDWKEFSDNEILNYNDAQTAEMSRYDRIMRMKTVDALMQVRAGLFDVKKSLHIVSDKLEARLREAEKVQRATAETQTKVQRVTVALTVVIALSTVIYTWITWQSVQVQREANQIQRGSPSRSLSPSSPTIPASGK